MKSSHQKDWSENIDINTNTDKLSTSTWEASFEKVRRIYNAVIQSAWAYKSAVWYHLKEM